MKTFLLGLFTGLILAGSAAWASSWFSSDGSYGVFHDNGNGSGAWIDGNGNTGVVGGGLRSSPFVAPPSLMPHSPC